MVCLVARLKILRDAPEQQATHLEALLHACAHCKKVQTEEGQWVQRGSFIAQRTDTQFSYGVCGSWAKQPSPEN